MPATETVAGRARPAQAELQGVAAAPPLRLTATGWVCTTELAPTDWVRCGCSLGRLARACGWWIGDWVRYGNVRYGERYKLAARITGYDAQTLMNMAYVASRFEISRRRENLSFSHHAELACLAQAEQDRWLEIAAAERLSVRALRGSVRDWSRAAEPCGADQAPAADPGTRSVCKAVAGSVVCPSCGHHFHT